MFITMSLEASKRLAYFRLSETISVKILKICPIWNFHLTSRLRIYFIELSALIVKLVSLTALQEISNFSNTPFKGYSRM
jgi:hypothetical protein